MMLLCRTTPSTTLVLQDITASMQLTLPSNERLTMALQIAQKHCGGGIEYVVRK